MRILGPVEDKSPVLFEPDEQSHWPTGLSVKETITTVKQGNSSRIDIRVTNITEHDIILPGRTTLGQLQMIWSIVPVEVKWRESPVELTERNQMSDGKVNGITKSLMSKEIPDIDLSHLAITERQWLFYQQHPWIFKEGRWRWLCSRSPNENSAEWWQTCAEELPLYTPAIIPWSETIHRGSFKSQFH